MAKQVAGAARRGMVKGRTQFLNMRIGRFIKRDTATGKILNVKADEKPFKGVRREK